MEVNRYAQLRTNPDTCLVAYMDALDRPETDTALHGSSADYQRDHGPHGNTMSNNIGSTSAASMIQLPEVK